MDKTFTRANRILPHHRFAHSLGGPLIRVKGTIAKLFASPGNHHGANHQHLILGVTDITLAEGIDAQDVERQLFIAIRFGDNDGLEDPIPFEQGGAAEMQGEYINQAEAYPTEDNDNPKRAVLHFTHHPVGFVLYGNQYYS